MVRDLSDALCNYLAKLYYLSQYRHTRYHKFREIHISDLASCPIKVILDRVFSVTPPCRLLYYMREGLEWENKAIESLKMMFPKGEAWKSITWETSIAGIEWKIVGTPDLYSYDDRLIVEVKWTRFSPREIVFIMRNKTIIGKTAWRDFEYFYYSRINKVWDSWYVQVVGYLYLIEKVMGARFTGYIYANRGDRIDLLRVPSDEVDKLRDFIEQQLRRLASLFDYYIPQIYPPHHNLETIIWEDLREVYCMLWKDPKLYSMVEYQCRLCPYGWILACPGLIPLRTFYSKEMGRLWDPEELERLRLLMGFSPSLQQYMKSRSEEIYNMLVNAKKEDLPKILWKFYADEFNNAEFIAGMIRAVRDDCKFAWRLRPPYGKTIILR